MLSLVKQREEATMWNGPVGYGMGAMFGIHWLLWIGLLAIIVIAIIALIRDWRGGHGPVRDDAVTILDIRYAKGEISREDYLRLRQDLGR
jgi:putative membrane protein